MGSDFRAECCDCRLALVCMLESTQAAFITCSNCGALGVTFITTPVPTLGAGKATAVCRVWVSKWTPWRPACVRWRGVVGRNSGYVVRCARCKVQGGLQHGSGIFVGEGVAYYEP